MSPARLGPSVAAVLLPSRVPLLVPGFTVTVWRCWSSVLELGAPCAGLRSPPPPQTNKECRSVRLSAVFQPSAALIGQQIHNSNVQWESGTVNYLPPYTPDESRTLDIYPEVSGSEFVYFHLPDVCDTHTGCKELLCLKISAGEFHGWNISFHPRIQSV